jgi:hypothetical protein
MLKQLSIEIFETLTSETAFTDVMDQKVFPILASENQETPLTTYRITELKPLSKESRNASFELMFWFGINQYDECVDFTDAMVSLLATKYRFISSTVDISEDTKFYNGIINLEKY